MNKLLYFCGMKKIKRITAPNLRIQSVKAMKAYLEDDLRIDFSSVQGIDLDIIRQYVEVGRKKGELGLLEKLLDDK
jgi:hypothetical protein